MKNNVNILEALEKIGKQINEKVPEPQQKTVEEILTDFTDGLSHIDFFMLKNAPEKGIKFTGEEYESVKGGEGNKERLYYLFRFSRFDAG